VTRQSLIKHWIAEKLDQGITSPPLDTLGYEQLIDWSMFVAVLDRLTQTQGSPVSEAWPDCCGPATPGPTPPRPLRLLVYLGVRIKLREEVAGLNVVDLLVDLVRRFVLPPEGFRHSGKHSGKEVHGPARTKRE